MLFSICQQNWCHLPTPVSLVVRHSPRINFSGWVGEVAGLKENKAKSTFELSLTWRWGSAWQYKAMQRHIAAELQSTCCCDKCAHVAGQDPPTSKHHLCPALSTRTLAIWGWRASVRKWREIKPKLKIRRKTLLSFQIRGARNSSQLKTQSYFFRHPVE